MAKVVGVCTHVHIGSAGGKQSHAGIGQRVHTEHAQSFHERQRPLQCHLLLASDQHRVQALQHDSNVVTGGAWKTAGGRELGDSTSVGSF